MYTLMKTLIKKWSPLFRNIVDELLPSPEEFRQGQLKIAAEAMAIYVKGVLENAKVTGVEPEFDLKEIVALIQQVTQESVTPPDEEELKRREKASKER